MKQQHVLNQIPDYVLDLLPQGERLQVEQHTVACPNCRQALSRETELSHLVRSTLAAASQPPVNLRQFMPVPRQRSWPDWGFSLNGQRQLAPLILVFLILVSSVGLYLSDQQSIWPQASPTFLAVTATMTDEPTATITETRAEQAVLPTVTIAAADTDDSINANQPHTVATPAPNPTPIAALPAIQLAN